MTFAMKNEMMRLLKMKIENDLGKDDIKQLVISVAIPSMLAQFVNVLYSVVDRMYIGKILLRLEIPRYFAGIFTQNEEYISLTVGAIRVYTMGIIPLALQYVVVDGFTGMGVASVAIFLSMFRKVLYLGGKF